MKKALPFLILIGLIWIAMANMPAGTAASSSRDTSSSPRAQAETTTHPHTRQQFIALARQDASAAGISPDLFVRQINEESGFNPNVVSPAGAIGIAQFMPATAAGLGINPHDPMQSLRGAARLMARYVHIFGSYRKALAAYNAGSNRLWGALTTCGVHWLTRLPAETQTYIHIILG